MPSTYKSPGVYVEEISKFPPSVAQVETAIPAFIGYTEKAMKVVADDLRLVPTSIRSLLEYEQLFGGAPDIGTVTVQLDNSNDVQGITMNNDNRYFLYDSLRLFFQNGGGRCYIISVGDYSSGVNGADLEEGLQALRRKDEPTIIAAPDASLLDSTDLYQFQQLALQQAGELQDRVVICDLENSGDFTADVENFRNSIGINYLAYGAAYTPWLRTRLAKQVSYRNVNLLNHLGQPTQLDSSDTAIGQLIADLNTAVANHDAIRAELISQNTPLTNGELTDEFEQLLSDYAAAVAAFSSPTIDDYGNALNSLYDWVIDVLNDIAAFEDGLIDSVSYRLKADINTILTNFDLNTAAQEVLYNSVDFPASDNIITIGIPAGPFTLDHIPDPTQDTQTKYNALPNEEAQANEALRVISSFFSTLELAVQEMVRTAEQYETTLDRTLFESFSIYKNIIQQIQARTSELPPSGAIAGVYARVDADRGVWKAPANVSLSGVLGLTEEIDETDQASLNVDVNAGKSINAIRAFTGKGILVWGARTLAGNDNEWRYISVRRFFNMAEESIKKASAQFVFEPNDANTWVKVRAMIENFLTLQWRAGALAGAKADDAFYVRIGLGQTMTSEDILGGLMIVEIGMAVVRPAEFIVLRFSHKMQEA
ncbi:MAG: phage tail sheath C-terminal domain-containing protein [Bacteroidota bacterium]